MKKACMGVDFVFHQAAIPSVPKSVLDPIGSNRVNIDGTVNLLVGRARREGAARDVCRFFLRLWRIADASQARRHDAQSDLAVRRGKAGSEHYMISFYRCYGLERSACAISIFLDRGRTRLRPYSGVLAKFITQMLSRPAAHDLRRRRPEPRLPPTSTTR